MSVCILWLQRWAREFQDSVYHTALETINGVEALNRLLKYQYLSRQKQMTLSHIISNITEKFLPALHYRYIYKIIQPCSCPFIPSRSSKAYNTTLSEQTGFRQQVHQLHALWEPVFFFSGSLGGENSPPPPPNNNKFRCCFFFFFSGYSSHFLSPQKQFSPPPKK